MEETMNIRNATLYKSINENKFVFPEQTDKDFDHNRIALAISGGGTRSCAIAMGSFRRLKENNKHTSKDISYVSSLSGGSWFSQIYTYADVDEDELLGKSIPLDKISRRSLNYTNFEKGDMFMGNVLINCPISDIISNGLRKGVQHSKIWDDVIRTNFLMKYNLNGKIPTDTKENVIKNKELYNIDCVAPRDNTPFSISFTSILEGNNDMSNLETCDLALCEFTSKYCGIRTPHMLYGGVYIESNSFGCVFEKRNVDKLNEQNVVQTDVSIHPVRTNTLESIMGSTSAAFGMDVLINKYIPMVNKLTSMTPVTNVWGQNSNSNHQVYSIDGGFIDFTGVLSLAARNCKRVVCFLNVEGSDTINNTDKINYCDYGMTHLFKMERCFKCKHSELRENVGIFSIKDWVPMRKEYEERRKSSRVAYFKRKMMVQPNKRIGVNGNYEMDLIMIPLIKNKIFEELIGIELGSSKYPELANFPNLQTIFENNGKAIELTNSQVNLLSTYSDWYLNEVMEAEPEFFNS